jgi:hypothetical protein
MKKRAIKDALLMATVIFAVAGVLHLVVFYKVATWKECRRIHPWWYCAGEK